MNNTAAITAGTFAINIVENSPNHPMRKIARKSLTKSSRSLFGSNSGDAVVRSTSPAKVSAFRGRQENGMILNRIVGSIAWSAEGVDSFTNKMNQTGATPRLWAHLTNLNAWITTQ